MTGWDWCKQVFDPEVVGYYNVSGNRVAFTTKAGKHHDLQVDDFADVEHGKALVYAKIGGKVPPVKQVAELPTLDEVMVDAPITLDTVAQITVTHAYAVADANDRMITDAILETQKAFDSAVVPTEGRHIRTTQSVYEKLVKAAKEQPVAPKKPPSKKALPK